ncbi:MAG TPA: SRPBCC domain-containing protein [Solirubrobacterales bacterium]|nr:SRPBCC domain-containing protein [Solirubrobacterales bacterium]
MGPLSAEIEVDAPRERVFEAISDLARRPAFTDHFLHDFRLTRIESRGVGAGARFRTGSRRRSVWMDTAIAELEAPHKLVERGSGGRANRIPATTVWELTEGAGSLTTVRLSHWTEPSNPVDHALEALSGSAGAAQRGWREALRRLRDQLESDQGPPSPIGVAGGNPHATGIP